MGEISILKFFILSSALISVNHVGTTYSQISNDDLLIDAEDLGLIQGKMSTTMGNVRRQYASFLGMRYAEPTTGPRRFLPSIRSVGKLNSTGGVFQATREGPACNQPAMVLPITQSEDCLTINVYTPNPHAFAEGKPLPVIWFIHGGAFTAGQGSMYDGSRLLNKDCVLVTFNYRLGILGFFSLGTEHVPGNAGLYDILNALKWTRDNVKYFGGDPNKITIAGQSAGSVAVTHLLASPLAQGLFHGAIASSGTGLAAWGTTQDPIEDSLKIAERSGCYDLTRQGYPNEVTKMEIAECMQNVEADVLVDVLYNFQVDERRQGRLGFDAVSPSVQSFDIEGASPFEKILPENPDQIFATGRQANVPLMMGATKHDGSYVLGVFYNRYLKDNGYLTDPQFMSREAVPRIMSALGIPDKYGVYESIAKMYLGDSRMSGNFSEMYPGFIDLFSVFFFKASSYQTALHHSRLNNDTYWYSFDYRGSQSLFSYLFKPIEVPPIEPGVTHSDDLMYLFRATIFDLDEEGYKVSSRMVEYWVNFATYGNPSPSSREDDDAVIWAPLVDDANKAQYLSINEEPILSQHYDDTWSDAGWELISPTETPTTTPSSSPSSSPIPSSSSAPSSSPSSNPIPSSSSAPSSTPPPDVSSTMDNGGGDESSSIPTDSTTTEGRGGSVSVVPFGIFVLLAFARLSALI